MLEQGKRTQWWSMSRENRLDLHLEQSSVGDQGKRQPLGLEETHHAMF